MAFDFTSAQLPVPTALAESFAENSIEADLKQLFADLYRTQLADKSFDANVLGIAHLGSLDLVRNSVNADGLVLMQGDREEAAMRYLYRAWKSPNAQGRGVHFLRTYLNLLFPGLCTIDQLWHDKNSPYPTQLQSGKPRVNYWLWSLGESGQKVNGSWKVGGQRPDADLANESIRAPNLSNSFLTSRIEISLDFAVEVRSIANLMHIIRSVIPARLLPLFKFMLRFILFVQAQISSSLLMQKNSRLRYPWCGRVIGDSDDVVWSLGVDKHQTSLPSPFGSFKVGKLVGGRTDWWLTGCRVVSSALIESEAQASVYRLSKLGEPWRRLNGTWFLGDKKSEAFSAASMIKQAAVDVQASLLSTQSEFVRMDYPFTAARLGALSRLSDWRRLDGRWKLGSLLFERPFGFKIRPDTPIGASSSFQFASNIHITASPETLTMPYAPVLSETIRTLDGSWVLGAETRFGGFILNGKKLRARRFTQCQRLSVLSGFTLARETVGAQYQRNVTRSLRLGSGWHLGGIKTPEFSFRRIPVI